MGLFGNIRKLFNRNIECGNEIDDHVAFLLNKKHIYLNKNILVREGTACVIVHKGKVCDVVLEGKYRINQDSIPETFKHIKKSSRVKNGLALGRLRVDIYYVNLREFKQFEYSSDKPFKVKASGLGKIKGYLQGYSAIRILDAGALIKHLIKDAGGVSNKNIAKEVGLLIGNKINNIIQKHKIPTELLLSCQDRCEEIINDDMQNALDKNGLFVSNVKLKAIKFPKKYQKRVNEYLSTHSSVIRNFDINARFGGQVCNPIKTPVEVQVVKAENNGAMQNIKKTSETPTFKVCRICGKKNGYNAKICINCGNNLQ